MPLPIITADGEAALGRTLPSFVVHQRFGVGDVLTRRVTLPPALPVIPDAHVFDRVSL